MKIILVCSICDLGGGVIAGTRDGARGDIVGTGDGKGIGHLQAIDERSS